MTKQERASEPIHVSKLSIALGALGFGLLSLAQSLFEWAPTGTRFEWVLMVLGSLSLAGAVLHHVDHHVRFGVRVRARSQAGLGKGPVASRVIALGG
jgi:hypothetical protein